ncbi:MAG: VOC family protein [Cognatishimia sp.]
MIGYVTVGTNDFESSLAFYDALFASIDIQRLWKHGNMAAWGTTRDQPSFCISSPFDGKAATAGNGTMIALRMAEQAQVNTIHAKALELGGSCEGAPGPRGDHGFYGGYFRDPEGNKLNAYIAG